MIMELSLLGGAHTANSSRRARGSRAPVVSSMCAQWYADVMTELIAPNLFAENCLNASFCLYMEIIVTV